MLNIPDSVKALFKQDGVHKNFRAHFPNGELPDITNDNIVKESVNFTESICSQDVFKFGLSEASVIEIETVGVGNMYGMAMECGIEIDCSSLSAADIADIEAGTWDGDIVYSGTAPVPADDLNGAVVTFDNANDDKSISELKVAFTPNQSGSGNPSPENARPITGWDAVNVWVQHTHDTTALPEVTAQLGQSVYGGTLDMTTGVLTVDRKMITFTQSSGLSRISARQYSVSLARVIDIRKPGSVEASILSNKFKPSTSTDEAGAVFLDGYGIITFNTTEDYSSASAMFSAIGTLEFCYPLEEPVTYQLSPHTIQPISGTNVVWADTGNIVSLKTVLGGYNIHAFRVPYGVFTVESCPRNHEAMAHRQVKAYTRTITDNNSISPYLQKKLQAITHSPKYTIDAGLFSISTLAQKSPRVLTEAGFVIAPAEGYTYSEASGPVYRERMTRGGSQSYYRATVNFKNYKYTGVNAEYFGARDGILYNVIFDWDLSPAINYVNSLKGKYGEDELNVFGVPWYTSLISFAIHGPLIPVASYLKSDYSVTRYNYRINHSEYGLYLYGRADSYISLNNVIEASYPTEIIVEYTNDRGQTWETIEQKAFDTMPQSGFRFEQATPPSGYLAMPIELKPTFESTGYKEYSFVDALDFPKVLNGWLEINSAFAASDRFGGFKIIRIDNTSPSPVIPGEYRQMWFDEYNVEPIGTIRYAYTDEAGEEQIVDYQFGDGASIYDMTDNEILKPMGGADPSVIEAILDASFIPHLAPVNFVPVDLSMKGLPYLEAGDALSVTAQDGTVCNSYALRQEISGVQVLEAQIDSQSGLIIESEAAT